MSDFFAQFTGKPFGDLIEAARPLVAAVKRGSVHEEHQGWLYPEGQPGRFLCGCGTDITNRVLTEWEATRNG